MKSKIMKKVVALATAVVLAFSVMGCGATEEAGETADNANENGGATYNITIVKQLDHASLDEIANAVAARLDAIAAENNVTINYTILSGQGEQSTLVQIGDEAIAEGVDAIIPIATLAAQVMTVAAEDSKTPVIYAAISDPEAASLTGIDYVSGTSDGIYNGYDVCTKSGYSEGWPFVFFVRSKFCNTNCGSKSIFG